jgi:hypothetical protein
MASVELRFVWPCKGQASFHMTQAEAMRAAVALRGLGLGLTLKGGQAMVTTKTASFAAAETLMLRVRKGL